MLCLPVCCCPTIFTNCQYCSSGWGCCVNNTTFSIWPLKPSSYPPWLIYAQLSAACAVRCWGEARAWWMGSSCSARGRPCGDKQRNTHAHISGMKSSSEWRQWVGAADSKTSYSSLVPNKITEERKMWSRAFWRLLGYNSTCVFLEVRVWFWHSAPSPLLPLVHCYKAQRRRSGWVSHTHTHTHAAHITKQTDDIISQNRWMNKVNEHHDPANSATRNWITTSQTNAHARTHTQAEI